MDVLVATFAVALLVLMLYLNARSKTSFPNGPRGVPFFGYAPFLGTNPGKTLTKLKKRYGPIMSVNIVGQTWVVLSDYDIIHDAFVRQPEIFSGRKATYFSKLTNKGHGLAFSNHEHIWKPLRKFGHAALRGLDNGKKSLEEDVAEEAAYLVQNLAMGNGDNLRTKLAMATANVISRVVYGRRFDHDNKYFRALVYFASGFFSDSPEVRVIGLISFAPASRHLPYFRRIFSRRLKERVDHFVRIREFLDAHKGTYDPNDMRDFVDAFLREIYNEERSQNGSRYEKNQEEEEEDIPKHLQSPFQDLHLLAYIDEMFSAGTATTAATIVWSILSLVLFPTIQEKLAKEVIDVLGPSGVPSVKHESEMPYVCAFIQELMRHRTLAPLGGLPHNTTKQASFRGFVIPKDTFVVANLWSVHHDPAIFKNPEEFRPERFIDGDGKFVKSDRVIPFSIGQRHCLGKQLAKMEIFMFLTSIVQKFRILPHPGKPLPNFEDGVFNSLTYEPRAFDVIFEER